jgi:hypothetical protein
VGVIAIEAPAFSRSRNGAGLRWTAIPHLGRTAGAVLALPQGRPATTIADGLRLEYDVTIDKAGPATLILYLAPTLDTEGGNGIRIGVSIDDAPPWTLQADLRPTGGTEDMPAQKRWTQAVCDNAVQLSADMGSLAAGKHVVKIWRLDDNVVLEKLVLSTTAVTPSYLGASPTVS